MVARGLGYTPAKAGCKEQPAESGLKGTPEFGQGDEDALVRVECARQFYMEAQEFGMTVKYVEKEGADHMQVVAEVMDEIFEWFDSHAR